MTLSVQSSHRFAFFDVLTVGARVSRSGCLHKRLELRIVDGEGIIGGGKSARVNFIHVLLHRIDDDRLEVGVALVVLRREAIEVAEQIVKDQHLPIAARAAADADRRNR